MRRLQHRRVRLGLELLKFILHPLEENDASFRLRGIGRGVQGRDVLHEHGPGDFLGGGVRRLRAVELTEQIGNRRARDRVFEVNQGEIALRDGAPEPVHHLE